MLQVLLVIQIITAVALIAIILIQHTGTDGLSGLGGGGGQGGALFTTRASANFLTRTTALLAAAFMANSMIMATIASHSSNNHESIVDKIKLEAPAVPVKPTSPSVPLENKTSTTTGSLVPMAIPADKTDAPINKTTSTDKTKDTSTTKQPTTQVPVAK